MTGSDALVDVAIVTWNTRDTTVQAIASLLAAEPEGTLRVLVRDNASSDGTAEAVAAAYPEVEVYAGAANLGFAGGVNTILKRSTAPWCLLLNSDAWPEPGAISRLVACAERHPKAAVVVPLLLRPDGALEPSAWPLPSLGVSLGSVLDVTRHLWPHDTERRVDWAVGAAWLMRRAAIDELGGLDESLFMYAEDVEWCWRAKDAGWEVWFTPDAVVRHIGNASGAQLYGAKQSAAWIANSVRVYRRHHGAVATRMWQAANALGATMQMLRLRADKGEVRKWRAQRRAWWRPSPDLDRQAR
jgi:GT2 family glycosyltransferase